MDAWHFLMIMFDWGMMERIPQPYLRAAAAMGGLGGESLKSKGKRGRGHKSRAFFFFLKKW